MKHAQKAQDIEAALQKGLRDKGYKLTSQRLGIIGLLARDITHPGAADILRRIKKILPKISISTIYYTLDILKKEDLIHELEFYDRDNRYDINIKNHINLICKKCGKIEDFLGKIPYDYTQIQEQADFEPVGMRFEYYGYCKSCRKGRK